MTKLFDTHAHYNDARFDEDRDELLAKLNDPDEICPAGVGKVVNIACCVPSSRDCVALADKYDYFYATVGLHPQDADLFDENTIPELKELAKNKKVVAIGEVGLDYKYPNSPKEKQKEVFREMMKLAEESDLPVCIHDRDAHGDCFDIIREFPNVRGVMHSYSGSAELAKQLIKRGWYLSFSGVLTFKNAVASVKSCAVVPLDRLLLETDCPYLAPEPYRGTRNDSRKAFKTAEKMAEIHGVSVDEMLKITYENACRFFNLLQK